MLMHYIYKQDVKFTGIANAEEMKKIEMDPQAKADLLPQLHYKQGRDRLAVRRCCSHSHTSH